MAEYLKNNAMAKLLGMTPAAFAKGVRQKRFTVAEVDKHGHNLFDKDIVIKEYNATAERAFMQNGAIFLPKGMQGGRPPKNPKPETSETPPELDSPLPPDKQDEYYNIKLAKEVLQVKMMDQKYKVKQGELIEKAKAQKEGIHLGSIIISVLDAFPYKLAIELASMENATEHEIRKVLEVEINKLIKKLRKKLGATDDIEDSDE